MSFARSLWDIMWPVLASGVIVATLTIGAYVGDRLALRTTHYVCTTAHR